MSSIWRKWNIFKYFLSHLILSFNKWLLSLLNFITYRLISWYYFFLLPVSHLPVLYLFSANPFLFFKYQLLFYLSHSECTRRRWNSDSVISAVPYLTSSLHKVLSVPSVRLLSCNTATTFSTSSRSKSAFLYGKMGMWQYASDRLHAIVHNGKNKIGWLHILKIWW